MTYKQAYNKIIDAYFKDEIKPFDAEFCFCGTLCKKRSSFWLGSGYSNKQLRMMEGALLVTLQKKTVGFIGEPVWVRDMCLPGDQLAFHLNNQEGVTEFQILEHPIYEDALFSGMSAALDVLKQIHIERGEIIDEVPEFVKRELLQSEV